jgi:hypothetical protein
MKVLVAGSSYGPPAPSGLGLNHFDVACAALGDVLAERGDQLVLLSDAVGHADTSVLKDYLAAALSATASLPEILSPMAPRTTPKTATGLLKKSRIYDCTLKQRLGTFRLLRAKRAEQSGLPDRQLGAASGHSGGRDRTAGSTRTKPSGSQKRVRLTSPEGQPSAGR